ncbi:MAG: hypothetical protein QM726_06900 [Chitinophagaceae bacterium]
MKTIATTIFLLLFLMDLYSQSTLSPATVLYTKPGAYSKNFTDPFSGATNQAALAAIQEAGAGVYGERKFLLKELSNYTAAIAIPSKLGGFAFAAHYFGGENFNSSQVGIGYGRKLSEKIDIGVQFDYNMIKLAGYGSSNTVSIEAGALFHLTKQLHMGLHVYNPAGGKFGKLQQEKLASVYTMGIGYEPSDKLLVSVLLIKEEDRPTDITASMQYNFASQFFSRAGVSTATGYYFLGLGVQWETIRIDAVSNWQTRLGLTPGIMLLFNFHDKKTIAEE